MDNKEAIYWHSNYPYVCAALESITGDTLSANAETLAYIAGDFAVMTDDEVIATIINEYLV